MRQSEATAIAIKLRLGEDICSTTVCFLSFWTCFKTRPLHKEEEQSKKHNSWQKLCMLVLVMFRPAPKLDRTYIQCLLVPRSEWFGFVFVSLKFVFVPQTVWPHWGVLTVTIKARCSIEVVSGAFGIFPVNFRPECLLWHVHVYFDCAGSHKTLAAGLASVIFLVKMPLVTCLCAFRLRRLAQNAGRGGVLGHFPCINIRSKCLSWHVHAFSTAQAPTKPQQQQQQQHHHHHHHHRHRHHHQRHHHHHRHQHYHLMQPLQYYLRHPAAKDNSITHAAAPARNLDAAIPLRSAQTGLQSTTEPRAAPTEIAAPKPDRSGRQGVKRMILKCFFKES